MFLSPFKARYLQIGALKKSRFVNVSSWGQLTHAFDALSTNFMLPKRTGLFGIPELDVSCGFYVLCDKVLNEAQTIVDDALFIADEIKCNRRSVINLIKTFDELSNSICNVADLAEFVRLTHPSQEFQTAARDASLVINRFVEKLNTNTDLYNALKNSLSTQEALNMDYESRHVAKSLIFDFEQSGIHLSREKRSKFVEIQESVLCLGAQFATGCTTPTLLDKKLWPSHIPHDFKYENDHIVIDGLCYDSPNAELREVVYRAYMHSNPEQLAVLDNLLQSRHELSNLVGFSSFLERSLRGTMAETPETVHKFLTGLVKKINPVVNKDTNLLMSFKQGNNCNNVGVMPWDTQYYTSLAKAQLMQSFPVRFQEYFSLGTCMEGLNVIFKSIYGISLEASEPEPGEVWHPSVVKLRVKHEDEGILGYIYCDLFYRENKVQQDCHFTIRGGCCLPDGSYQLPVVVIVCNFPSSRQYNATLLSHSMMENLYHEMGHAMHSMLARTRYQHVTGTRTTTDFVEVPSILMEYYVWHPVVLAKLGRHYRSGKELPPEAVQKLCKSRSLFSSLEMQTQVFYSMVDHIYHAGHPLKKTTTEILKDLQAQFGSTPYVEGTSWQQRFSHLHGGYAGRYYSYLWCRAVASRIWTQWFSEDPFSRESGERYRRIFLQYGGGRHPRELVENMLEEEISVEDLVNTLETELHQ